MPSIPDGQYDRMTPGAPPLSFQRPWDTHEEQLTTMALESLFMPGPAVAMLPCPLSQVVLFPPRLGYRTEALGIRDVVNLDRSAVSVNNYSGGNAGYLGASRNSLGTTG